MECHRTGTKAGRGALSWKGCAFTRLFWSCAGTVLLRRCAEMLLLSALSAKDFAEAIVKSSCCLSEDGGQFDNVGTFENATQLDVCECRRSSSTIKLGTPRLRSQGPDSITPFSLLRCIQYAASNSRSRSDVLVLHYGTGCCCGRKLQTMIGT